MKQENAAFLVDYLGELSDELEKEGEEKEHVSKLRECAEEVKFDALQRKYRMDPNQSKIWDYTAAKI